MRRDAKILVIDDETAHPNGSRDVLSACGYEVETASTGRAGIDRFRRSAFDVVLTELQLPDMDAFEVLRWILAIDARAEVIVTTGHRSVRLAIEAVKAGAFHLVQKPCEPDRLCMLVESAVEPRKVGTRTRRLRGVIGVGDGYGGIIGRSEPMRDVFAMIEAVATSDANVLIVGESGTGKELIADAIHARSPRAARDFVKINCAALPRELVENELFGHVRGAFTGATHDKQGLVGAAAGGSLLLDEIGEMPVELQPKLLRVLQERRFARLGSGRIFEADFRLIASTNEPPANAMRAGRLREDLYYRISTITIVAPPLRERGDDVGLLADHVLKRVSAKYGKRVTGFTPAAYAAMVDYEWPGNVRELENVIERAVLLARDSMVGAEVLPRVARIGSPRVHRAEAVRTMALAPDAIVALDNRGFVGDGGAGISVPTGMTLAEVERYVILQTLRRLRGNKTATADALGIYRPLLYARLKQYNLTGFMSEERTAERRVSPEPQRERDHATDLLEDGRVVPLPQQSGGTRSHGEPVASAR